MASANTHLKKQANNILDRGRLLPQEFSDHVDMLKRYETSSLQNFRDNNLSFWGNIDDQHLGNSIALLSNDKNYLIVISQRNRIHIYNFSDKTPVLEQSPYTGLEFANGITCATLCNTNKSLFVGCNDGSLGEIDLSNGVIKQIITVSTRSILSLTISYNEEKLIFCDSERVYILDVESKSLSEYCSGSGYEFVSFLGNNHYVFTGGNNFRDSGWFYKIQKTLDQNSSFKEKQSFTHFSAKVIGNTEYYMVLSNENSSSVFNGPSFTNCQIFKFDSRDKDKDTPFRTVKLEASQSADFDQLQFHITRDKRFLLCYGNRDSTLYIYHLETEKTPQLAKIPNLARDRSKAIFAEDDSCLVLVAPNGEVRVCKFLLEPNHIINEFFLFNYSEVLENSLIISDDGNLIAYFQMNKDVKVWDIKRQKYVLIVRKERFDKELYSATMKFSQLNEIRIEYRFRVTDFETLHYSIPQTIRPEMSETGTEIHEIDFNQRAAEHILINEGNSPKSPKSPKKYDDENEPLNNNILRCKEVASHNELEKSTFNPTKQDISKEPSKELVESRSKHIPPQDMLDEDNSWYKKALSDILSQKKCEIVVMSHSKTHLFLGFEDSTVKVYNYPALQQVSSWRNEQRTLVSIATSPNDRFILTLYGDGYVEIRDFNFVPPSASRTRPFYSFQRHFNLNKLSWEESFKNPENYYLSREQSVLHMKCLANSDDLPKLKYSPVSNIPFLRDMYNRTPLHYLLSYSKLDYRHLDAVATYILDYMEALKDTNQKEYQYVLNSLNEILPILILKLHPNLAAKYIDVVAPIRAITEKELETNVFSINKKVFFPGNEFKDSEMAAKLPRGQEQIIYKELGLKIDYKIQSKDILEYTVALSELEVEDLFKLPAIIHLVDYIWTFTRRMNIMLFNWWAILMILLSVCVGLGERSVGLEITILVLASFGVIIEAAQAIVLKSRYWNAMWNQVDLVSIILIYIYIIFKMSGFTNELAENWIAAFMIFTVYIRLAGYLRLFKETRILIEVIVNITRDMISFLIIMILITIGFSIIFLKFLRNDQDFYLWHLYYSYQLWYGNTDGIPSDSPSVLVLECAIMFIMPVMLLNLLVTLMGESREKVKENEILANSKTRLAMSIEALAIMRIVWGGFWSKKTEAKRVGTFLYVGVPKTEETETTEKTSEIAELQKQIQDMMEIVKSSKEEIAKISQETSEIKAQMVQPLPKIELDFDTKQKSRGFY